LMENFTTHMIVPETEHDAFMDIGNFNHNHQPQFLTTTKL
jgi:hypothetical protein